MVDRKKIREKVRRKEDKRESRGRRPEAAGDGDDSRQGEDSQRKWWQVRQ